MFITFFSAESFHGFVECLSEIRLFVFDAPN